MSLNTRAKFINAQSSEKIILAHVQGRARLYNWTIHSGDIYVKIVPHFVVGLKQDDLALSSVSSIGAITEGTFFYDSLEGKLYAHFSTNANPVDLDAIVSYRFFYSSRNLTATYDLTDLSAHVQYNGRIQSSPGYSHAVGIDEKLTSIIGTGTLKLKNGDGALDPIFESIIFENQPVEIYSWNPDLSYSLAKIIYRGRITNKAFTTEDVSFKLKDTMFDLEQSLPMSVYDDNDQVNDNIKGRYKRWLYGRVDGLQLQSINQLGIGYNLTGTVSAGVIDETLTGVGTLFLSEASPGDTLTIDTQEFEIQSIQSDTQLTLNDVPEFGFSSKTALLKPEISTTNRNREYFIADHSCAQFQTTVTAIVQLNRIQLASTGTLKPGDFLDFVTGERHEIRNIAPNNVVVLQTSLTVFPPISSVVTREPVQRVYKDGKLIPASFYTISNIGSCKITFGSDLEFNLAKAQNILISLVWTNGSRVLTTSDNVNLADYLSTRDYIRPMATAYTTYYEILSVNEQTIELREPFNEATITDTITAKLPDYLTDSSIVSAQVLGKTEDGTSTGNWIQTSAQAVRDILSELNINDDLIDQASFDQSSLDADALISLALPLSSTGKAVKGKEAVDKLNEAVYGSLTLNKDLKLKYQILQNTVSLDPFIIRDEALIDWKISSTNGKAFRTAVVRYQHKDVDPVSLEAGTSVATYDSDFIKNYLETSKQDEFDLRIYESDHANIMAQRYIYFNRLGRTDININSDLRLEDLEIGAVVQIELNRMFKRYGSNDNKRIGIIISKKVTGKTISLEISDLGNTFNSTAIIAPNTTNDYANATDDEKLRYGFITNAEGIVEEDEITANINLIG